MQRAVFEPKGEEIIGRRKVHTEELHDLYFQPNINRLLKSRTLNRRGM
jgi:hypothetical protein